MVSIATTVRTSGEGGIVFDYQGPSYYKFVALSVDTNQILIGHVTDAGTVVDKSYSTSLSSGTDYKLGVMLRGGLVNVSLNGAVLVSNLFNETVTTFGGYGVISMKGATSGQTSFDILEFKTDDAAYASAPILQVEAAPAPGGTGGASTITDNQLAPIVVAAEALWTSALGAGDTRLSALSSVNVEVADLPDGVLGETSGKTILVDSNAAGWGWFVDPTPQDSNEFQVRLASGALGAAPGSPAYGHMDLLSTVLHEMGNAMGFSEDLGQDVTGQVLAAGVRTLPGATAPWSDAQAYAGLLPDAFGGPAGGRGTAGSAPTIDWSGSFFGSSDEQRPEAAGGAAPQWVSDFLNHSGRSEAQRNPNLGIRLHVDSESKISPTLGAF
jgi:hypothetical protein